MKTLHSVVFSACVALLVGCGGGGTSPTPTPTPTANSLAQICAKENPYVADALDATTQGSLSDEKKWVNAYMTERYYWYKDIPSVNPEAADYNVYTRGLLDVFSSLDKYFGALRSPKITASGNKVDKFSFITTTAEWNGFVGSTELGYGYMLKGVNTSSGPVVNVSYVYPNTPAKTAGMLRGDQILSVDGISVSAIFNSNSADYGFIAGALFPTESVSRSFLVKRGAQQLNLTMTAKQVDLEQAEHKVLTAGSTKVGYLLFNSHVPSAEQLLIQAGNDFKQQGVTELVVDLRYNGGGYLYLANALASSVAGRQKAQGKIFEYFKFSDKRSSENEATFFSFVDSNDQPLPLLNLSKIYVLVTGSTCSASEAFVNGLRGVDVEVELIGSTTCGKPHGYYAQDNCGITYAAMEFEGVNAKGEGDFGDGMRAQCVASDDLGRELGDPAEGMLGVAMKRIQGQTCSQATAFSSKALFAKEGRLLKPEWQANKILKRTP